MKLNPQYKKILGMKLKKTIKAKMKKKAKQIEIIRIRVKIETQIRFDKIFRDKIEKNINKKRLRIK
jgi:hypothetical protein